MKKYLVSIFASVILSAIVGVITPDDAKFKKYIGNTLSLFLLLTLISPIKGAIDILLDIPGILDSIKSEGSDVGELDEYIGILAEEYKKNISERVTELVSNRYLIPQELISVGVSVDATDSQNIRITSLTVTIAKTLIPYNPREMEEYLADTVGVPCTVKDST